MGVSNLWDNLQPAFEPRVPFCHFATQFYRAQQRPIRLAIDAYIWLIEASSLTARSTTNGYIQTLHARVRELVKLHVSFVFVFDGKFKPKSKGRTGRTALEETESLHEFQRNYYEVREALQDPSIDLRETTSSKFMIQVTEFQEHLAAWNIPFLTAAGEAEAECARLQMAGVVDYVVTNDSDVLLFGCRKVLRNFSKIYADKPPSYHSPNRASPERKAHKELEFWVTPVDMEKVRAVVGLDRQRLLLLVVLRGGDYDLGVGKLGMTKSLSISLSGSPKSRVREGLYKLTGLDDTEVDFSLMFFDIFVSSDYEYLSGVLPDPQEVELKYVEFFDKLLLEINTYPLKYFPRRYAITLLENIPPLSISLLYLFPALRSSVFMFKPGTVNYAELSLNTGMLADLGIIGNVMNGQAVRAKLNLSIISLGDTTVTSVHGDFFTISTENVHQSVVGRTNTPVIEFEAFNDSSIVILEESIVMAVHGKGTSDEPILLSDDG
ncbi:hypothetical protein BABINDRAFT_10469 [Babjeviella inositovora NRRL Y-12698]|uniref:XPG-I domain-containing protein n=1 Tax=Babjeviella inositovora NRRL Y-12698 TaxID=984486 RepID=A0A1E3QHK2_9ASCO|nr:uncharacterized protein BABINDRAFT_10469 [Babjeviella inositovora NRRL Y-12698]ODQ77110.1 hypothetical protein BABINDRAFT_10469 [Babjeviella inositovora NRRL Y-12698]